MSEEVDYDEEGEEQRAISPSPQSSSHIASAIQAPSPTPAPAPAPAPSAARVPTQAADDDEDEDGEIVEDAPPPPTGSSGALLGSKRLLPKIVKTHVEALERLISVPSATWAKVLVQLKIILDARNRESMKLETLQKVLSLSDELLVCLMYWCRFMCQPMHIIEDKNIKKLFAICSDLSQEDKRRVLEQTTREEEARRKQLDGPGGGGGGGAGAANGVGHGLAGKGIGAGNVSSTSAPAAGGAAVGSASNNTAKRADREINELERLEFLAATECLVIKALPHGTSVCLFRLLASPHRSSMASHPPPRPYSFNQTRQRWR